MQEFQPIDQFEPRPGALPPNKIRKFLALLEIVLAASLPVLAFSGASALIGTVFIIQLIMYLFMPRLVCDSRTAEQHTVAHLAGLVPLVGFLSVVMYLESWEGINPLFFSALALCTGLMVWAVRRGSNKLYQDPQAYEFYRKMKIRLAIMGLVLFIFGYIIWE
jgi:hypothetical protein